MNLSQWPKLNILSVYETEPICLMTCVLIQRLAVKMYKEGFEIEN